LILDVLKEIISIVALNVKKDGYQMLKQELHLLLPNYMDNIILIHSQDLPKDS